VQVCIDGTCQTQTYTHDEREYGEYAVVTGLHPPNPDRIDTMRVTTFGANDKVVRSVYGRSLDLPAVKEPPSNSCACSGLMITYDDVSHRFTVTTQ
jgi:hypothetical protein